MLLYTNFADVYFIGLAISLIGSMTYFYKYNKDFENFNYNIRNSMNGINSSNYNNTILNVIADHYG